MAAGHGQHEALPLDLSPMLATAAALPSRDGWVFEVKWDGVRGLLAHRRGDDGVRIWSRAGNVVTGTYPELAPLAAALADHDVVLDGEIVAFDAEGRPSFQRIQQRLGVSGNDAVLRAQTNPIVYVVFDLLHLDGCSTRSLPWSARRALLEQIGLDAGAHWRLSSVHTDGALLHEATLGAGLEGVVAKRSDSIYRPAVRHPSWIKKRHNTIDEFVIGGWVPGSGRRANGIGALLLGVAMGDDPGAPLRWVGKVGTGFNDAELDRLAGLAAPLTRPSSPFANDPGERAAVFVEPVLRCRVEYREFTTEGILRFPSYKGLVESSQ